MDQPEMFPGWAGTVPGPWGGGGGMRAGEAQGGGTFLHQPQVFLQQEPCPQVPSLQPRKHLPSGLWPWAQGSTAGIRETSPGLSFTSYLGWPQWEVTP